MLSVLRNMSDIDQNVWVANAHISHIAVPPVAPFGDSLAPGDSPTAGVSRVRAIRSVGEQIEQLKGVALGSGDTHVPLAESVVF